MKKMKLLCAALTVIMLLTACSGSTSSAAEKVIGTTDKVVAADTLKPLQRPTKKSSAISSICRKKARRFVC